MTDTKLLTEIHLSLADDPLKGHEGWEWQNYHYEWVPPGSDTHLITVAKTEPHQVRRKPKEEAHALCSDGGYCGDGGYCDRCPCTKEGAVKAEELAREYDMMVWSNADLAKAAERYSLTMPDSQARALLWLLSQRILKEKAEVKAHPHAENMRLYYEDACKTDKPWELWECKYRPSKLWIEMDGHPLWEVDMEYRRKPTEPRRLSVTLANGEVVSWEAPMREAPEVGAKYWYVFNNRSVVFDSWGRYEADYERLNFGICYLTKEAAEEHLAAMRKINGQEGK